MQTAAVTKELDIHGHRPSDALAATKETTEILADQGLQLLEVPVDNARHTSLRPVVELKIDKVASHKRPARNIFLAAVKAPHALELNRQLAERPVKAALQLTDRPEAAVRPADRPAGP